MNSNHQQHSKNRLWVQGQFWVFTKTIKILSRFGVLIRFKGMLFDFLGLYWSNKVIWQPFFSMIGRQGQFRKAAYVCFWGRVLLISLLWWQQQMIRYAMVATPNMKKFQKVHCYIDIQTSENTKIYMLVF